MKKSVVVLLFIALFCMSFPGQIKTNRAKRNAKAAGNKPVKATRRLSYTLCYQAEVILTEAEQSRCGELRRKKKLPRH